MLQKIQRTIKTCTTDCIPVTVSLHITNLLLEIKMKPVKRKIA